MMMTMMMLAMMMMMIILCCCPVRKDEISLELPEFYNHDNFLQRFRQNSRIVKAGLWQWALGFGSHWKFLECELMVMRVQVWGEQWGGGAVMQRERFKGSGNRVLQSFGGKYRRRIPTQARPFFISF